MFRQSRGASCLTIWHTLAVPEIAIDIRPAPDFTYYDIRWAWLAVHDAAAIGALAVAETRAEVKEGTGEQLWPRHATISYVYSEVKKHGIARKLLLTAQAHLAAKEGLVLYRSGVASAGGRAATTCAGVDLPISPKARWQHADQLAKASRRGEDALEIEIRLDDEKAEKDGAKMLGMIAARMDLPLLSPGPHYVDCPRSQISS